MKIQSVVYMKLLIDKQTKTNSGGGNDSVEL